MTPAERHLLIQRLDDLAEEHEAAEDEDNAADTDEAHEIASWRDPLLASALLREAIAALTPAPSTPSTPANTPGPNVITYRARHNPTAEWVYDARPSFAHEMGEHGWEVEALYVVPVMKAGERG